MALPKMRKRPIEITLKQYVVNPTGKGSGNVAARYRIRESLNRAFVNIIKYQRKRFQATPYVFPDKIIYHVVVPSELGSGLTYDVFIELRGEHPDRALRKARFWSNSPSFTYFYAYVMYHTDLMIKDLANKFDDIVLQQPPEIRNPNETLGYEKSTYFAARYLMEGGCLKDNYIIKHGVVGSDKLLKQIYRKVISPDAKTKAANIMRKATATTIKGPEKRQRKSASHAVRRQHEEVTKDINIISSVQSKIKYIKPGGKNVKPETAIRYIKARGPVLSTIKKRASSKGPRSRTITARKARKSLLGK